MTTQPWWIPLIENTNLTLKQAWRRRIKALIRGTVQARAKTQSRIYICNSSLPRPKPILSNHTPKWIPIAATLSKSRSIQQPKEVPSRNRKQTNKSDLRKVLQWAQCLHTSQKPRSLHKNPSRRLIGCSRNPKIQSKPFQCDSRQTKTPFGRTQSTLSLKPQCLIASKDARKESKRRR